jgi:hypothetical protein
VLLLGVVTVLVTALIPIFLWRLGAKQAEHDAVLNELQTKTLGRQEQILRRQRRDALLDIVGRSSDATHLGLLWHEVREYEGTDRDLLLAVFRTNVALALPGTFNGVKIPDDLTDTVVGQYVNGLERRYAEGARGYPPYAGLLEFVATATDNGAKVDASRIVALVTGPTSAHQRPGHGFYRDLVNAFPECAGALLYAVEKIDSQSGGLKLNVLTGTLLAIKDAEIGRLRQQSASREHAVTELRNSVPAALATLLHRDDLRSFDRWSLEGSTEPVTATVAWLIRATGWLVDADDHLAVRMTQNLAAAIKSIPNADKNRGWGIDDEDVRAGFESIKVKRPKLWETYGVELEAAATRVGSWEAIEGGQGNV